MCSPLIGKHPIRELKAPVILDMLRQIEQRGAVDELPEFIRTLEKNEVHMSPPTRILTRLMMLVFIRTSEPTETQWREIDLDHEVWVVPWQRMKMGKRKVDHHVFLPRRGWAAGTACGHRRQQIPVPEPQSAPPATGEYWRG